MARGRSLPVARQHVRDSRHAVVFEGKARVKASGETGETSILVAGTLSVASPVCLVFVPLSMRTLFPAACPAIVKERTCVNRLGGRPHQFSKRRWDVFPFIDKKMAPVHW